LFGLFKMKFLAIGLLAASPPVAAWALRGADTRLQPPLPVASAVPTPAIEPVIHLPVEIVANGAAPEWVRGEVRTEAVPEPGVLPMVGLPLAWWLLRRRR
jgi:hypothetical protein